jgi:L-fuconolactonase
MGLDLAGHYRYPPPDPSWLARAREEVIDPTLPIIDAHHHLWEEGGHAYLLDELAEDLACGHNVVATVLVQAGYSYRSSGPDEFRSAGETEAVTKVAKEAAQRGIDARLCAAIVAFADLTLGDRLEDVLDEHRRVADGRLRGIRHSVSYDSNFPDGIVLRPAQRYLLANPAYREGLKRLVANDLSYDAMLYHQQLPELADMARAVPDLRIMLDHYGTPIGVGPYRDQQKERFRDWRRDMVELAQCPNVHVKLGGLGMIITGAEWHERPAPPSSEELAESWRPWFETAIELFGAERCVFESNFPVDKAMYDYVTLWNAFKRLAAGASQSERAALFHDNAARFYRI